MNIYICDLPIQFPRSEYGGQVVVIAESKKAVGKMLTEHYKKDAGSYFNLKLSVETCKELELASHLNYQPGIVASFET